jgi:hypothetical protein
MSGRERSLWHGEVTSAHAETVEKFGPDSRAGLWVNYSLPKFNFEQLARSKVVYAILYNLRHECS